LVIFAFNPNTLGGGQEHSQQEATNWYQDRAEQRIAIECLGLSGASLSQCANEITESAERDQRSQSDFEAQARMARATDYMAWAAFLSVGVAVVGIYFIKRTLDETARASAAAYDAVKTTREMGEAQVRAYLTIKEMMLGFNDSYTSPQVKMTLVNTGQSPARDVEVVLGFSFFPKVEGPLADLPELSERRVRWWFDDVTGGEAIACKPTILSDVRLDEAKLGQHLELLVGVHLSVAVFAKDVFEKEVTTFGHFAFGWSDGEDKKK
jgi:hypothetical protein